MRRLLAIILVSLAFAGTAAAQRIDPDPQFGRQRNADPNDPEVQMRKKADKEQAKQRYAKIKADTDRLLKLSEELKKYVDETKENVLSLDVIKKAAEIEKLSKEIREKMTDR